MQGKFETYINKTMRPYFEQLEAQAHVEGIPFNHKVGEAVEFYIKQKSGRIDLIAEKQHWNPIINNASNEQLLDYHKYISEINNMILRKLNV